MRFILMRLAAGVLVFSGACGSFASASGAQQPTFAGTWVQREAVLGTSFTFTFAMEGEKATGTGTYARASDGGNRAGAVTVTDLAITADTIYVAMTYDNGELAQFQGRLEHPSVMSGSLHFGSALALTPSAVVAFDRKK